MSDRQTLGKLITGQPNKPVDLNAYQICGEDFVNNTLVVSIYDLAVFLDDGWTMATHFTKSQKEAVRKFLKEQSEDNIEEPIKKSMMEAMDFGPVEHLDGCGCSSGAGYCPELEEFVQKIIYVRESNRHH